MSYVLASRCQADRAQTQYWQFLLDSLCRLKTGPYISAKQTLDAAVNTTVVFFQTCKPFSVALQGSGCPICAGTRPCRCNSLAAQHPLVAAEWHPTLNGRRQPSDVLPGSRTKVWWQCRADPAHAPWKAQVLDRYLSLASIILCCPLLPLGP